jgi:hypothetical protein
LGVADARVCLNDAEGKPAMKSMRTAHILVVGDCSRANMLVAQLRRMALGRVTAVVGLIEARALCQRGGAHACIFVRDDMNLDQAPLPATEAPGRGNGVPSMIMVPAVTAYERKAARRDGYMATLPANIGARVLYRRIGAALQSRGAGDGARGRRQPAGIDAKRLPTGAGLPAMATGFSLYEAKLTLH